MQASNAYVAHACSKRRQNGTAAAGRAWHPLAANRYTGDSTGTAYWMAAYNPEYGAPCGWGLTTLRGRGCHTAPSTYPGHAGRAVRKPVCIVIAPDFTVQRRTRVPYRFAPLDNEHVACGQRADAETESYAEVLMGTEPREVSNYWQIPTPPDRTTRGGRRLGRLIF